MTETSMMLNNSSLYTDMQSLQSLQHQYKDNPEMAHKEVAQQFESLLLHTLIKSMRDGNKAFESGLMSSEQSSFYEDMFDKQLAQVISKSGTGLASTIENYLNQTQSKVVKPAEANTEKPAAPLLHPSDKLSSSPPIEEAPPNFDSAVKFIQTLWSSAKEAAHLLGADPKLLLAQAALETNWGKKIIPQDNGKSTHNLFNIKADKSWNQKAASFETIEEADGVLVKEKAKFRAYDSFKESFLDYVNFLKDNERYKDALKTAANPGQFIQSLQKASYATDKNYAEKIMQIFSSKKFNQLFEELHLI